VGAEVVKDHDVAWLERIGAPCLFDGDRSTASPFTLIESYRLGAGM
jgi:hypothetical protein